MSPNRALVAACLAGLVSAQVASAQVQVVFETRFLVQTITGSGAARQVSNAAGTTFESGSRVRLTVQYRLVDQMNGSLGNIYGPGAFAFSVNGTNTIGNGALSRSALTTAGSASSNGESDASNNLDGWANGPQYPQTGAATITGLHQPFRFALNGSDNNQANGTVENGSITRVTAMSIGGGSVVNQLSGNWWGLYSFEFQAASGFVGSVGFSVFTNSTTMGIHRGPDASAAPFTLLTAQQSQYNMGSIALQFAQSNSPPVANVTNRVIIADPFTTPDANGLSLVTFADANPGNTIDVIITNDGGIGALGGLVSILGDNSATPSIVLNWNAPNAAIGQVFTVTFAYTNGIAGLQTGTATVQVIPAPGSAALIAFGGLLAARRRRR